MIWLDLYPFSNLCFLPQVCGYLSPGFEKYLQKAHFHEEHPLEDEVNCSKYMYKMKAGTEAFSSNQQAFKVGSPMYRIYLYIVGDHFIF